MELENRLFNVVSYVVIVIFALAFLYVGNLVATRNIQDAEAGEVGARFFEARVTNIVNIHEHTDDWVAITFEAEIVRGEYRGEVVNFTQNIRSYFLDRFPREARVGDRVMLSTTDRGVWNFVDYIRIHYIVILGGIFVVLMIIFGRMKGFNSILSLGLTCTAIFAVFIPSILSGMNIYISAIVVCVHSVITTLFIINGVNKKSAAAVSGCLGGVVAAGLITFTMNRIMELTGITQTESIHLLYLSEHPIDLNAIIFASIIIGAVGAIMDMSVSISSALWELKRRVPDSSFGDIFRSGVNIGKDIIGSNINTLILAYIGSSLTVVLIFLVHNTSFLRLFNREWVVVELLQAIVGSFGIFLTMPLTALICAALYSRERRRTLLDLKNLDLENLDYENWENDL